MESQNFFYKRSEIGLTEFPDEAQIKIPFQATRLIVSNDSDTQVDLSFKHPSLHGELLKDDSPLVLDGVSVGKIWFRSPQNASVRVWAWRL